MSCLAQTPTRRAKQRCSLLIASSDTASGWHARVWPPSSLCSLLRCLLVFLRIFVFLIVLVVFSEVFTSLLIQLGFPTIMQNPEGAADLRSGRK